MIRGRGESMTEERLRFYKSQAWKRTAANYARSKGYLCELCRDQGLFVPGEFVHHKIFLTDENFTDPSISLDESNLMLVCRDHHAELHRKKKRRYKFDELGNVIPLE